MKTDLQTRIRKFGIRRLAEKMGVNPSMTSRWAKNGVPSWRVAELTKALRRNAAA